jgi:hypothetical protein
MLVFTNVLRQRIRAPWVPVWVIALMEGPGARYCRFCELLGSRWGTSRCQTWYRAVKNYNACLEFGLAFRAVLNDCFYSKEHKWSSPGPYCRPSYYLTQGPTSYQSGYQCERGPLVWRRCWIKPPHSDRFRCPNFHFGLSACSGEIAGWEDVQLSMPSRTTQFFQLSSSIVDICSR